MPSEPAALSPLLPWDAHNRKLYGNVHPVDWVNPDPAHEHLGQLIAYARMNRIVPPWSK